MSIYVIATDGRPLSRPRKMSEFLLGPGQRIDAIAIGPPAGEYALSTSLFNKYGSARAVCRTAEKGYS